MSDITINFDKIWASAVKNLEYPEDSKSSIGFDFLGDQYPSTHLHDVIFKDIGLKNQYLWRQIAHACSRYGVEIKSTDDESYTNALGEAINQALLKQIRASEQNTGIIKLADTSTVQAGTEYNQAISPAQFKLELSRVLKDYTTNVQFWENWKNIKPIATSGQLEDGTGYLNYNRISNIPRWIRETHDDGNFLYIRSVDATQFRLGGSYLDMFNSAGETSFRINAQTGLIDIGTIDQSHVNNLAKVARDNNYYSLTNLPTLADSTNKPMRYGADVPDFMNLEYDDGRIPSLSIIAQQRDGLLNKISLLDKSLSTIAKSGKITDAIGDLPWDRIGEKPSVLNNIYNGNGDTVVTSSSGAGKLSVSDEWINFFPKGKDSCFSVGPDGRIYNAKINHDQVLGLHAVAVSGNYGDLNDKPFLADSTNKPMRYGVDVQSYKDIKYEDDRIPSVSILAQLRDGLVGVINDLENSLASVSKSGSYDDLTNKPFLGDAAVKGVIYGTQDPNDAGWDDEKVASGAYIKTVMNYLKTPLNVGTYLFCQPVSGTNEMVPGTTVSGQLLRPSSCTRMGGYGDLPGIWACCGYSVNSNVSALEKATMFVRIS